MPDPLYISRVADDAGLDVISTDIETIGSDKASRLSPSREKFAPSRLPDRADRSGPRGRGSLHSPRPHFDVVGLPRNESGGGGGALDQPRRPAALHPRRHPRRLADEAVLGRASVGDDGGAGAAVHPDPHLQPRARRLARVDRDGAGGGDGGDGEMSEAGGVVGGLRAEIPDRSVRYSTSTS